MSSLVACNVYITAGGQASHRELLRAWLRGTQADCRTAADGVVGLDDACVVVHAYADIAYNRSSLHLAGAPGRVAGVAERLAARVFADADRLKADASLCASRTAHPTVGLVDHIAIMPLETHYMAAADENTMTGTRGSTAPTDLNTVVGATPSVRAARAIGAALQSQHPHLRVLYYGDAHPTRTPLATIRREATDFFRSGSAASGDQLTDASQDTITIGAPSSGFVENYNLRLRCDRKQTITLTQRLRSSGQGTVEALTLRYSEDRQEVACNLLRPDLVSAEQVQAIADAWDAGQGISVIECGYRVGTTATQCLAALSEIQKHGGRERHDERVLLQLEKYLSL